jgi:hypothetical protein
MVCWTCLFVWLFDAIKRSCPRRIPLNRTIPWWVLRTLARTKASLTTPINHIAPIYMVVASRAWLGWLLHYYLHCPLIDVCVLLTYCYSYMLWHEYAFAICYSLDYRMSHMVGGGVFWWWVWMRSCKPYRRCRFTLKSYHGDRLEYAS